MAWVLTRGLTTWRNELNVTFPNRDKASDGSIGDVAHAQGTSGHNNENSGHAEYNDHDGIDEVRAIDVDKDLRVPGVSMEKVIQYLVTKGRRGDYLPFRYFIYNGRIWSKASGWKTQLYLGSNKHDKHAHFSGDFGTKARTQKADEWTGSLGLFDFVKSITNAPPPQGADMAFDDNDKKYVDSIWTRPTLAALPGIEDEDGKMTPQDVLTRIYNRANGAQLDIAALRTLFQQTATAEATRDAQEAARDAALTATLDGLVRLLQSSSTGNVTMSPAQFAELKQAVLQKVVEAGQDASDQAAAKLVRIADALDNAGAALSSAGEVTAQK